MVELTEKDKRRLAKLDALEAGGVDNWEWYSESLKDWFAENEKLEIAESFMDELLTIICNDCKIEEPAGRGCGYGISDTKPLFDFIMSKIESSQKEQSICHAEFHTNQATIRSALTAQDVNKGIDLDNAREVFENWLTGNGNYPHLKHKSFGGIYLHEEAAIKWDGFKAGYYARAEAQKVVGE